jgi:hypothetical protein
MSDSAAGLDTHKLRMELGEDFRTLDLHIEASTTSTSLRGSRAAFLAARPHR